MKIKYLGPSSAINVGIVGPHVISHTKGQIIDYPDEVAKDLLLDKKNNFEGVKGKSAEKTPEKTADKKANGKKP